MTMCACDNEYRPGISQEATEVMTYVALVLALVPLTNVPIDILIF